MDLLDGHKLSKRPLRPGGEGVLTKRGKGKNASLDYTKNGVISQGFGPIFLFKCMGETGLNCGCGQRRAQDIGIGTKMKKFLKKDAKKMVDRGVSHRP